MCSGLMIAMLGFMRSLTGSPWHGLCYTDSSFQQGTNPALERTIVMCNKGGMQEFPQPGQCLHQADELT